MSQKIIHKTVVQTKEHKPSALIIWLKFKNDWIRVPIIAFITIILLALLIGSFYLFYWYLLGRLWFWGFTDGGFWSGFFAVYGALFLIVIPFAFIALFLDWLEDVFDIYANDARKEFQEKLDEIEKERITYEEKLEKTDSELLIPLITYSKLELETYYKIGLSQTQKSYRYSILAMWIGFLIIISGIIMNFIPSQFLDVYNPNISENVKILIISSGAILELVSGLFLWIYRNSMKQLTYFYNRQIFIHNSLFAFRIAQSMNDSDAAKKEIVDKILEFNSKK